MRLQAVSVCLVLVAVLSPGAALPVEDPVAVLKGKPHPEGTNLTWIPILPVPDDTMIKVWRKVNGQETLLDTLPVETHSYLDDSIFPLEVVQYRLEFVSEGDVVGISNPFFVAEPFPCRPVTLPPDPIRPECLPP